MKYVFWFFNLYLPDPFVLLYDLLNIFECQFLVSKVIIFCLFYFHYLFYFFLFKKKFQFFIVTGPKLDFAQFERNNQLVCDANQLGQDCMDWAYYWENHYSIIGTNLPSFLEGSARKILNTGKYLNVVQQCGGSEMFIFLIKKLKKYNYSSVDLYRFF